MVELTHADDEVIHAHPDLTVGHRHLERPNPVGGLAAPSPNGTTSFAPGYYCQDVDKVLTTAVSHGAQVLAPATDFVSGDRFGAVRDPFGSRWSIMSRIEDVSESDSAARIAARAGGRNEHNDNV